MSTTNCMSLVGYFPNSQNKEVRVELLLDKNLNMKKQIFIQGVETQSFLGDDKKVYTIDGKIVTKDIETFVSTFC